MTAKPPLAQSKPRTILCHGVERTDEYAWLRADNWREVMCAPGALAAPIRQYLEAENAYTRTVMRDTEQLQRRLFIELKGRIEEDYQSVPVADGAYAYYVRYRAAGEHPIYCRHPVDAPEWEEILLDGNAEAKGCDYFAIGDLLHSPDHRRIAYCLDTDGSEFYTLHIRDLASGALLETIERVQGDLVWSNDAEYVFYVALNEQHRPEKVCRHRVGTPTADDVAVYREDDPGFFIGLDKTRSRRFITIDAHAHETSECRLIDAHDPCTAPVLVRKRCTGVEYDVEHHGDSLLIRTNAGGAKDYKLVQAPCDDAGRWRDFYLPAAGVLLEDVVVFEDWLVRCERADGLPRLVVTPLDAQLHCGAEHVIAFDEACYELAVEDNDQFTGDILRFAYSSPTTPEEIYDYDMRTRTRTLRKRQQVPSGHDPRTCETRRILVAAGDGEKIPLSLLYARATPPSPDSPLLLYAYGAYGHSVPAAFSTGRLSLVERGFVFAIAHVRGGMEKGHDWYRGGKMENKANTFNDFTACARHLIDAGMTSPSRLAICGGSAGGMLIGAVLNTAPELFGAALADVPFVDVLTTMSDESLPLTPPEWVEWGNPVEDEDAYRRIAAYSPYDNVRECAYPHLLVTAGLSDPRVTYWEPAKWVARLRAKKTDDNLLLLKTNMSAGHAGRSGRYEALKELALQYAFLLKALNISE